jgi:hypothetical protein
LRKKTQSTIHKKEIKINRITTTQAKEYFINFKYLTMAATSVMNTGKMATKATNARRIRGNVRMASGKQVVKPGAVSLRSTGAIRVAPAMTRKMARNVQVQASATEELTAKAEEYFEKAKTAWAENDSKPTTLLIAGAAVTTLVVADGVLGAVEKLPLVPQLFEIVGISFTAWFVYRYLLFKPDRAELKGIVDDLLTKVKEV